MCTWLIQPQLKQYESLKHTDDDTDAFWLAHLLRLGILPTGYIYPKQMRAMRDLLRKRRQLVQQQTGHVLSIENQYVRLTGSHLSSNATKKLTEKDIRDSFEDPNWVLALESNHLIMKALAEQIKVVEQAVFSQIKLNPRCPHHRFNNRMKCFI